VIRERIVERLARYLDRDPATIYVHYLDVNLPLAVRRADEPPSLDNGYFIVGELMHAGLESLLSPAPQRCVDVPVWDAPLPGEAARFVRRGVARLCGTADAVVDGYVVEFKTTARSRPPWTTWRRRARHYAMLYERPVVLFVVNRVTGETTEAVVEPPRDPARYREWVVNEWLRNRYPHEALDAGGGVG